MALMADFQKRTNAAILLITHDLGVVAEMCDRVLVMYAGQIVEEGTADQIFRAPKHPYTVGLLESLPQPLMKLSLRRDCPRPLRSSSLVR